MHRASWNWLAALCALAGSACHQGTPPQSTAVAPATFVGSQSCAACHQQQAQAWSTSQHHLAMQVATEQSVLAPFAGESLRRNGVSSAFSRRSSQFLVRTDAADGAPADFAVAYTFGIAPLQQYLVALPGGRLQALGQSWDSRPAASGGQRWFELYPATAPRSNDPLHWSGYEHNWNFMCADCHATNLRKNYDAATDTYSSTWSELGAGCEACHGPASRHLEWAARKPVAGGDALKGLTLRLDERAGVSWTREPHTGTPMRSMALTTEHELDVCARCHSRRSQLRDDVTAADPFGQGFHVALLDPGLYFPDGQMRDEVYNYGSFLQSRMYAAGVICSDCHEPHSGQLRVPGDGICLQCHDSSRYALTAHHMHVPGSSGARCASCHMPIHTYMEVDQRHDHSLRIPQPMLSASVGAPDACTSCHRNRTAQWAETIIAAAHPKRAPGFQRFGAAFARLERGTAGGAADVLAIARDRTQPAIVRASALQRLSYAGATIDERLLVEASRDASPLLRGAAARAAPGLAAILEPLLRDPLLSVRTDAVNSLLTGGERPSTGSAPAAFSAASDEFLKVLRFNSDRPDGKANLAGALAALGDMTQAATNYQAAIRQDSGYTLAYLGLADVHRAQGDDAAAAQVLQSAWQHGRDQRASIKLALGLLEVRRGRYDQALAALAAAASLEPDNAQIVYTYAVALYDRGNPAAALRLLEQASARRPDAESLRTLLGMYRAARQH